MPNHIKNKIVINADIETVNSIFEKYNTHNKASIKKAHDDSHICINKEGIVGWLNPKDGGFKRRNEELVIGLPEGFEIEISDPYDHFPDFNKIKPQPENIFNGNLGQKEEEECAKNGRPTWYRWNIDNWGTKWNCYSCEKESFNTFTFETAWSGVLSLIKEISIQNPIVEILYKYSDEDFGYNCASFKLLNGEIIESLQPEGGSFEAYEIAFDLRPDRKSDYALVDGSYEYIESEY